VNDDREHLRDSVAVSEVPGLLGQTMQVEGYVEAERLAQLLNEEG
jgi:hypothetical protein